MRSTVPLWLKILAGLALAVHCLDALAWWEVKRVTGAIAIRAEGGADLVAKRWGLSLPGAVQLTSGMPIGNLAGATRESVVGALERLGENQRRWMPAAADGYKNLGRAALLADDSEGGLQSLEAALERDSTSPYLHRLTALVLRSTGQVREFMEHMGRAEALAPGYSRPFIELTPEDAQQIRLEGLRRHVVIYPRERVSGLLALAAELRRRGLNDEALGALESVAGEPEVLLVRARWALEEGRAADVAELLTTVSERRVLSSGLRASAWSLLAQAHDLEGRPEAAEGAAREALRLSPASPAPYLALAGIAARRGDVDGALGHVRSAWGIAPADINVLLAVARVAERAGRIADARLALERAAEVAPERPEIAALLVDFHLRHGELMDAALALSRFLDRFPADSRLLRLAERLRSEVGG